MVLFIINPNAGRKHNLTKLENLIKSMFPEAEISYTQYQGHARELATKAANKQYNIVVAVGGDGTINEIVQGLAHTNTALGILPCGSGNGLARQLKMPLLSIKKCLEIIKKGNTILADIGMAGSEYFINLAGIGFEALIAHKFANSKTRGALPYFEIGFREYIKFRRIKFYITPDNSKRLVMKPLCVVFANGKQYGSNFTIAPDASLNDGFLDMIVLPHANPIKMLLGMGNFFIDKSSPIRLTNCTKIKEVEIYAKKDFEYHIDGEPRRSNGTLKIKLLPKSIKLIVK